MWTILVVVGCFAAAAFSGYQLYLHRRERARELERWYELQGDWMEYLRMWWDHRYERKEAYPDREPLPSPPSFPAQGVDRLAPTFAAILIASLTIASATVLLDGKVGDASASRRDRGAETAQDPAADDRGALSETDRNGFRGEPTERRSVERRRKSKRLCLMRYAERQFDSHSELTGRWWTTCRDGRRFATVEDVKEELALPARFGAVRDVRVIASVPAGTRISYYEGPVAPQCEHEDDHLPCTGHRYGGGAWQYLFPQPNALRPWVVRAECTREREDRPSEWQPCAG